jgi:hypothetical protein
MARIILVASFSALFAVSFSAQELCVTVSPNPAPIGSLITMTGHSKSSLAISTPSGCWVQSVRAGTPNGTPVQFWFCIQIPVAIPGCGTTMPRFETWDQTDLNNAQVPPGLYWFEIQWTPTPFGPVTTEWHCVTISSPTATDPVLGYGGPLIWGSVVTFFLTVDPALVNALYAVALSGSTNTGISFGPGIFVSLDPDAIFDLTIPVPDPNYFVNFQGLVPSGGTVFAAAVVPPLFIGCFPLHAQAAVIDSASNVTLSNAVSFTIQ